MQRARIQKADHDWLRRVARRMARSPGSADDLVQETCLTALDKPAPTGEMRPWLRAIMRNLALGDARGGARRWRREDSYGRSGPTELEPDPLLDYGIDRARLGRCVDSLPEPFRSTVIHRFVDGLSCAEIARAEGVPAGTVRWRQSRALELLRAELERPASGRRAGLLWLPTLALARVAAVVPRPSRLAGLARWGAALVGALLVALAVMSARGPGGGEEGALRSGSTGRVDRMFAHSPESPAFGTALGAGAPPAVSAPSAAAPDGLGADPGAARGDRDRAEASASALEALREAYERAMYDCTIEEGVLRCELGVIDPRRAGDGTCRILHRSLAALARVRRGDPTIERALPGSFLAAAWLADLALATALGCAIPLRDEPEPPDWRQGGGAGAREPTCTSEDGEDGRQCTTCVDADGEVTTACAPVDCETKVGPGGEACTTCTGSDGRSWTECAPEEMTACVTEVREYGMLCTRCEADGGARTECLVAVCMGDGEGCLECTDGRGRSARDCSIGGFNQGSWTAGSGDVLRSTSVMWGHPAGTPFWVHYAGTSSCSVGRCLDCQFADGSGHGQCPYQGDLDEHLLFGRPDLPAPGICVTSTRGPGIECTTCALEDLSASTMCRLPPTTDCSARDACATCSLVGGGVASICE